MKARGDGMAPQQGMIMVSKARMSNGRGGGPVRQEQPARQAKVLQPRREAQVVAHIVADVPAGKEGRLASRSLSAKNSGRGEGWLRAARGGSATAGEGEGCTWCWP